MHTLHSRIWSPAAAILLVLIAVLTLSVLASAQETPAPGLCFAVADRYIDSQGVEQNAEDTLAFLDRNTGHTQSVNGVVPNIDTQFIEAIAFQPGGAQLFAADKNRLGTLNLQTGEFTEIGMFGSGQGQQDTDAELEEQPFIDVDSLSFNPITGEFWGVHYNLGSVPDVLFKIDPATGSYIPGAFTDPVTGGQQVDYVQVQPIDNMNDISDIAIDPLDGTMYGLMNSAGGPTRLVTIDPTNGATAEIGFLTRSLNGETIQNVDGLGFDNSGILYGTTGANSRPDANALWAIDKQTAVATYVGAFSDNLTDIEALDCLSSSGEILLENYVNGVDADRSQDAISVRAGESITWTHLVRNGSSYDLSNVVIVDDNGTPGDANDDITVCEIPTLAPGQSNVDVGAACQQVGVAQAGEHGHVATVTANDPVNNVYQAQDTGYYVAYTGVTVSGRVWRDVNQNNIQDPFEADQGIEGVAVTLLDSSADTVIANTTTTSNGTYLFQDLQPGEYYLTFALPAQFVFAIQDQGSDDNLDSDVDADGRTANFILADGEIKDNVDAGLIGQGEPATIQGYVWEDLNGDGIQNDGDSATVAIAGATVTLHTQIEARSSNAVSSTITAEDGSYSFANIEPAQYYYLVFALPEGYNSFTRPNRGDSDALDSDAERGTGKTAVFPLGSGEVNDTWDAGMVNGVTVDGRVWQDTDKNGLRDQDEPGVTGVSIALTDSNATVISTTTSLAGASYLFTHDSQGLPLLPGEYQLTIASLPAGYIATQANVGSDDSLDSDFVDGTVAPFTLTSGGEIHNQDLGVYTSDIVLYLPLVTR